MSKIVDDDDDDDIPQLSAHALAALNQFYAEQKERDEKISQSAQSETPVEIDLIQESWQLSQFWYDAPTIDKLASAIMKAAGPDGSIALVSTPSLYKKVKELHTASSSKGRVVLLEYDKRFKVYPDFVFFDYNSPLAFEINDLPAELPAHSFDVVVADPPFLAEECLEKTSKTVRHLAKDKIILCSGLVMKPHAAKFLNLRLCKFRPTHSGGRLSNEFACFANFDSELEWDE